MSLKLYIGGLPDRTRESEVFEAFSKYGEIQQIDMKDRYCFILFKEESDANKIIDEKIEVTIREKRLTIEVAKARSRSEDMCFCCNGG